MAPNSIPIKFQIKASYQGRTAIEAKAIGAPGKGANTTPRNLNTIITRGAR